MFFAKYNWKVKEDEMGGACSTNGTEEVYIYIYRFLMGNPERKSPLGKSRQRWIILGWIFWRWNGVMWPGLVWLRIGNVEIL
jgi:hypothetical protein